MSRPAPRVPPRRAWRHVLAAVCCAVFAVSATAAAQPLSATLLFDVRDTTDAPLPGVTLSVVHVATGVERRATTTASGTAVIPLLAPGDYDVSATLAGFRRTTIDRFHLAAGAKRAFTLVLEPGDVSATVTVTADAARTRMSSGAVGEIFDGQVLLMTPVASRDIGEFAWQAGGAAPPAPGSRLEGEGGTPVNLAGARETANNFLLDGADNNDLYLNRVLVTPNLDAVQEFTLLTSTYDAEYGRSGGGQVNVVTKSGGERLSGSAYEYFRDRALESRGVFDPADEPEPFRRRHQFGATLGGPARALGGFFFAAVEGIHDRTAETRIGQVPTAAERGGDFSAVPVPIVDPFTGRPFPGNRIPADRIDPAGARLLSLYPLPNRSTAEGNYVASPVAPRDSVQFTLRTDHRFAADVPLTFRYTYARDDATDPFGSADRSLPGFGARTLDVGQHAAVSLPQVFGNRLFNELRVGYNRLARDTFGQSAGIDGFERLGIAAPPLASDDLGYPSVEIAGLASIGDDVGLPVVRRTQTLHVSDTFGVERGRHHLKAGGELRHYRSDGFLHLFQRGQLNFFGAFTGHPVADVLLGLPTVTLRADNDNPQALRTTALNLFVQDDWRPTDRLTINAGLRYELNTPPVDAADRMAIFDPATETLRPVGRDGIPRAGIATDRTNLAPRIGVSWGLREDGRLTLRGGYGIYYDVATLVEHSALYYNPPYFLFRVYAPGGPVMPTVSTPFPEAAGFEPPAALNTLAADFPTAFTHQGSLGLEGRAFGLDLSARWVGSAGRNLIRKRNLNQPPPGPGPVDARRPIPGFGDILYIEPAARSVHHSLQLRAERRASAGLWFRGVYTWGKSIDDASAFLASEGNDNTPQNSARPDLERGLSDFDVRHRAVIAVIWDVPETRLLGRGWQVSALVTAQSGRPFTPRVASDNSNTGNVGGQFGYDRPDEVAPGTPGAVEYRGRWFRTAAPFTFGNAGRNILIGPGYASVDVALVRRIAFGARHLDLRAEIYNLLDRTNYGLPDSFIDRATFGRSLSAGPGRMAQVAVRFGF